MAKITILASKEGVRHSFTYTVPDLHTSNVTGTAAQILSDQPQVGLQRQLLISQGFVIESASLTPGRKNRTRSFRSFFPGH